MDWIKAIGTVAPTVATALGGPLAGMAVNIAAKALGVESDESSIRDAVLAGDPKTMLALKQAEANLKLELEKLDVQLEELSVDDRKSARELAKQNMRPQIILSVLYTLGYMVVLWQFLTGNVIIPADSKVLFGTVLGALTAAQTQIMNFWFGSSHGSKTKDKGAE